MSIYLWILIFILYIIFCRHAVLNYVENRSLPGGYLIYQFIVYLRVLFKPNIKKVSDSEMDFIVWFCDIDNYGHMNNCVYNTYCDYGRLASGLKTFGPNSLHHLYCVVAQSNIQYIRPMKLFQRFTLRTSIVVMKGKNVYFKQVFESHGKACAVALMRCVFLDEHYHSVNGRDMFLSDTMPGIERDFDVDGEVFTVDSFEKIPDAYENLTDDINNSIESDYKRKDIPMIVRSTRSQKPKSQ